MTLVESARCRLCADPKPYKLLFDLRKDEERAVVILKKLCFLQLQVITNLDSATDDLPKTICFECCALLENAYRFAYDVGHAQGNIRVLLFCFGPELGIARRYWF